METSHRLAWFSVILAAMAVAGVIGLGVSLRLVDPLSAASLPAEDPYTHMAYVREHLREGALNPLTPGSSLYPPGFHAAIAAAWVFTGIDLYTIMRFGPVLLGAIAILGIALLVGRGEGRVAAIVAALALALAPEVIFRTTMMAPTALDLAYIPFFLLALVELLRGRLAWVAVLAPLALFIVLSHPWVFALLGAAGGVFLVLALLFPWGEARAPALSATGLALAMIVMSGGLAGAVRSCWTGCGAADFGDRLVIPDVGSIGTLAYAIAGLGVAVAVTLLLPFRPFLSIRKLLAPRAPSRALRGVACGLFAVALVAVTLPAVSRGMPENVDLGFMLGWPLLALAALAFVALPFLSSPTALLGASLAIVTYPFVIYNPLSSEFWPSRTAVYFGIAAVVLVGVATRGLLVLVARAWTWSKSSARRLVARTFRRPAARARGARPVALVLPTLVVGLLLSGVVYAETPAPYPPWYRLYGGCEFAALQDLAARAADSPRAIVMTASWEAKVVLAALTPDSSRVWYYDPFFISSGSRAKHLATFTHENRSVFVVVEPQLVLETPKANLSFLSAPPWHLVAASCADRDPEGSVLVYQEVPGRP